MTKRRATRRNPTGVSDANAISAFLAKKEATSKQLSSTGTRLSLHWPSATIAEWVDGKIKLGHPYGNVSQSYIKKVARLAPAYLLTADSWWALPANTVKLLKSEGRGSPKHNPHKGSRSSKGASKDGSFLPIAGTALLGAVALRQLLRNPDDYEVESVLGLAHLRLPEGRRVRPLKVWRTHDHYPGQALVPVAGGGVVKIPLATAKKLRKTFGASIKHAEHSLILNPGVRVQRYGKSAVVEVWKPDQNRWGLPDRGPRSTIVRGAGPKPGVLVTYPKMPYAGHEWHAPAHSADRRPNPDPYHTGKPYGSESVRTGLSPRFFTSWYKTPGGRVEYIQHREFNTASAATKAAKAAYERASGSPRSNPKRSKQVAYRYVGIFGPFAGGKNHQLAGVIFASSAQSARHHAETKLGNLIELLSVDRAPEHDRAARRRRKV